MDEEGKRTDASKSPDDLCTDLTAQSTNALSDNQLDTEDKELPKINDCPTVYTFHESQTGDPEDNDATGEYDITDGASMDANFDDASSCCISEVSSVSFQNMSLATDVDDINIEGEFAEEGCDTNNEFQDEDDASDTPVILGGQEVNSFTLTTRTKPQPGSVALEVISDEAIHNSEYIDTERLNDQLNRRPFLPVVIMPSGYENVVEIPPVSVCKPTNNDFTRDNNGLKHISSAKSEKSNSSKSDETFGRRSPGLARRFIHEAASKCDDDLPKSRSSSSLSKPGRAVRSAESARDHKSSAEANQADDRRARMCQMDAAYRHHVAMVMQNSYVAGERSAEESDQKNHNSDSIKSLEKPVSSHDDLDSSLHLQTEESETSDGSKISAKKKYVQEASSSATMPSVEDGLSSGNNSDADEASSPHPVVRAHDVPTSDVVNASEPSNGGEEASSCRESNVGVITELEADRKHAESSQNVHKESAVQGAQNANSLCETRNGRVRIEISPRQPGTKPAGSLIDFGSEGEEVEAKKRDMDVERAIRDIKSAIEQSKKTSLRNPDKSSSTTESISVEEDPVWITRTKTSAAHGPTSPAAVQTVSNVSSMPDDVQQATARQDGDDNDEDDEAAGSRRADNATGSRLPGREYGADEETDELLDKQYVHNVRVDIPELTAASSNLQRQDDISRHKKKAQEVAVRDGENETVLMEGVLFRAAYLGSTQLISEGQPSKAMRMMQAQEAVGRIKAPEGEHQPRTEVDLFVSVEKLMVLNTDLQEIMMDYSLRTISYIADVGDILVLMARRGPVMPPGCSSEQGLGGGRGRNQSRVCCHLFESDEAQLIAQSIGQAFQVAYLGFLKANGIQHPRHLEEMDYQEVLNQQEIFGEELYLFSNRDMQREILLRKQKGEPLGVVIVESGWGSMVPAVVLANMCPTGAAARCGRLNIGDQIMSINDVSLVGLPLSTCQSYIKASKYHSVVKLTVVSCPPVVEVLIKRPDIKYQLGFSVQNGVICSLLRGGIAERGGVRVGHHIIEINGQSVVAVSHERIVNMLATSVGEISMKTMPTSIYRLLTGQDVPHYI